MYTQVERLNSQIILKSVRAINLTYAIYLHVNNCLTRGSVGSLCRSPFILF